jgi:UDP:flavonoid glycosyltransferase YjiC (YdhE family)
LRYLFVTFDGGGNLPPELALARRLRDRGHEVRFVGHQSQRAAIERAGLAFIPSRHAPDHDSAGADTSLLRDWALREPMEMAALILTPHLLRPARMVE